MIRDRPAREGWSGRLDPVVLDHQRHGHVVTAVQRSGRVVWCVTCGRSARRTVDDTDWVHVF
jgi:hypothetical protein